MRHDEAKPVKLMAFNTHTTEDDKVGLICY